MKKITIEIWSDIVCPFCYIGKRHLEKALENFPQQDQVSIEWKSYLLDPELKDTKGQKTFEYLAQRKGISLAQSKLLHENVTAMAARAGLKYDFDKAIISNTHNAHRLSHLAAQHQLQNIIEEKLFAAYFCEGKNISDTETLVQLGKESGLSENDCREMLNSSQFTEEVETDIETANQIGVRGVPFFVFNRKFAISGAQPVEVFTQALEKAAGE